MIYSLIAYVLVTAGLVGLALYALPFRHNPFTAAAAFSGYLLPMPLVGVGIGAFSGQVVPFCVALLCSTITLSRLVPRYVRSSRYAWAPRHVLGSQSGYEGTSEYSETSLVVMTANLRLGRGDAVTVVRLVRERHVGLLMLCELTPSARTALREAGLDALLAHNAVETRQAAAGVGIWSRTPLAEVEQHKAFTFPVLSARLLSHDGSPAAIVVAAHMPGPWPRSPKLWHYNITRLRSVLSELATKADRFGTSVLVGGDFNATLDTAQFRALLRDGYDDAGQQCGAGLARTYRARTYRARTYRARTHPAWPMCPPMIGIDHLLVRDATAHSLTRTAIPGSDHRAVIVTLGFPPR